MNWIKEVITDVFVTLFIAATILYTAAWMWWVIIVYTGLILVARLIVLAADDSFRLIRKTETGAPDWFYHLLYALNTGMLAYAGWWYAASGWLAIWILSFLSRQKLKSSPGK